MATSTALGTRKRLVVGNWKMYIETPDEAKKFAAALKRRAKSFSGTDAWLAPSFTLLPVVAAALKGSSLKVGGQAASIYDAEAGKAHTGEVSAKMLKAAGASFAIVGHSERRARGESDQDIHAQLITVVRQGMVAVVCVGEVVRSADGAHFAHIAEQLRAAFTGTQAFVGKIIVAYEPVWAIGKTSGDAMAPQELEEMVIFIKKTLADTIGRAAALKVPILYGGSVEPDNAAALVGAGVSGFLVGHASADVDSFVEILKACKK